MKRFQFVPYKPRKNFWIIRLNLVVMLEMKVVEFTFGILWYGLLAQFSYRKDLED